MGANRCWHARGRGAGKASSIAGWIWETQANSPGSMPQAPIAEFSLTLDLMSPTFEEVNHLWGFLGAKESPFALYRGRLVSLTDMPVLDGTGLIQDVDVIGRDATA